MSMGEIMAILFYIGKTLLNLYIIMLGLIVLFFLIIWVVARNNEEDLMQDIKSSKNLKFKTIGKTKSGRNVLWRS